VKGKKILELISTYNEDSSSKGKAISSLLPVQRVSSLFPIQRAAKIDKHLRGKKIADLLPPDEKRVIFISNLALNEKVSLPIVTKVLPSKPNANKESCDSVNSSENISKLNSVLEIAKVTVTNSENSENKNVTHENLAEYTCENCQSFFKDYFNYCQHLIDCKTNENAYLKVALEGADEASNDSIKCDKTQSSSSKQSLEASKEHSEVVQQQNVEEIGIKEVTEKKVCKKCIICKESFSDLNEFQIHVRTHLKVCKVTLKRLDTTTLSKPNKVLSLQKLSVSPKKSKQRQTLNNQR